MLQQILHPPFLLFSCTIFSIFSHTTITCYFFILHLFPRNFLPYFFFFLFSHFARVFRYLSLEIDETHKSLRKEIVFDLKRGKEGRSLETFWWHSEEVTRKRFPTRPQVRFFNTFLRKENIISSPIGKNNIKHFACQNVCLAIYQFWEVGNFLSTFYIRQVYETSHI